MMTDDQILLVVRAHKEGKKIQGKHPNLSNVWVDLLEPINWDFLHKLYRVAPEPRKLREYHVFEDIGGKPHFLAGPTGPIGTSFLVREVATSGEPAVITSEVKTFPETILKPREWWIDEYVGGTIHVSKHPPSLEDMKCAHAYSKTYHAREVLE